MSGIVAIMSVLELFTAEKLGNGRKDGSRRSRRGEEEEQKEEQEGVVRRSRRRSRRQAVLEKSSGLEDGK